MPNKKDVKKKPKLFTITQMAERLGLTRQAVRKAIVEGRLKYKAYKIGNNWIVEA